MGSTHVFSLLSSSPRDFALNPRKNPLSPNFPSRFRSSSSSTTNQGSNSDAFRSDPFDFDYDLRREKQRNSRREKRRNSRREKPKNWWSDDDDSDDEDEDDGGGFGFWKESNAIDWVFKVLGIFGWMVPAVVVSTLHGTTGTDSLIMAVVIPLGQTALSLVVDRLWGNPISSSNSSPRYKSRPRPRRRSRNRSGAYNPFVGTAYGSRRKSEAREAKSRTSPGRGGYESWRTADNSSAKIVGDSGSRFGGWDELDDQVGSICSFSREGQSQEVIGNQRQEDI